MPRDCHLPSAAKRVAVSLLSLLCLLVCSTSIVAQSPPPIDAKLAQQEMEWLSSRCDGFFRAFTDTMVGHERAIRDLIAAGPLVDRDTEIVKLVDSSNKITERYGKYTGHEMVSSKMVGTDLVYLRYLYKAERFPVVWHFIFYRTTGAGGVKKEWTLISLKFDGQIEQLLK